jgi:hypothetical protein
LAPGTGYRVGDPVIFDETVTDGFGAVARVSQVSPDNVLNVDNTIIGDSQNVRVIDFYPPEADTINNVRIIDYLNFEIVELGGILAIEVIEGGENYDILPDAFVGQQVPNLNLPPGVDAQVQPRSDSEGVIQRIDVVDPGAGYIEHPLWPQADLTQSGDGTAVANVNVGGGPFKTLGYWLNDDGHLSSKKFLQDGDFYQYYSYQLKVDLSLNTYRDIVKEIVHPAGMKMFGLVAIETPIDTRARIPGEELPLHFTEYRIDIHPLMETPVEYELEKGYSKVIKPAPFKVIQFPIFIFPYEDEIINGYDHIVLEDFDGFTQEKSDFNRQAVVNIFGPPPSVAYTRVTIGKTGSLGTQGLYTYSWDGNDWTALGNPFTPFTTGGGSIATIGPDRIVRAGDFSKNLQTAEFDGTDWIQVGNTFNLGSANGIAIGRLDENRIAIYRNGDNALRCFEWDGTDWSQIGNDLVIGSGFGADICNLTTDVVAVIHQGSLRTYSWDGTNFTQVGNSLLFGVVGFNTDKITRLDNSNIALLSPNSGTLTKYSWDGNDWVAVGASLGGFTSAFTTLMSLDADNVAYINALDDKLGTYNFNGATWSLVGNELTLTPPGGITEPYGTGF